MPKFIVDANLPYRFSLWKSNDYLHVYDIGDELSDEEIWNLAKQKSLIIITKDADFSSKVLFYKPPPKVIHLKIGNLTLKELFYFLQNNWAAIIQVSDNHKLTNVYIDRIEGIE